MQGEWVSSKSPAFIGGALGILVGLVLGGVGINSLLDCERALPFVVALIGAGVVQIACCVYAMMRTRIAWAFAMSLNGTGAVVFLFGAPKVRDAFETNLLVGFIPCFVFLIITVVLSLAADEY